MSTTSRMMIAHFTTVGEAGGLGMPASIARAGRRLPKIPRTATTAMIKPLRMPQAIPRLP